MTAPLLKWAGGKREQAARIAVLLGAGPRPYAEPFLGGASVFLGMADLGLIDRGEARLADACARLVRFYQMLQQGPRALYADVNRLPWGADWPAAYADLRAEFNEGPDPLREAALLLWLNRHGYNGLYRENGAGGYNVPCGKFKVDPKPPGFSQYRDNEWAFAKARVVSADFHPFLADQVGPCRMYADPPFAPLKPGGFTGYTGAFGFDAQRDLVDALAIQVRAGSRVVASNHDLPEIRSMYEAAGFTIEIMSARRRISRTGDRTPAPEILCYAGPL